jgi:hypothetical protein
MTDSEEFEAWYRAKKRQTINRSDRAWAALAWEHQARKIDRARVLLQSFTDSYDTPYQSDLELILEDLDRRFLES